MPYVPSKKFHWTSEIRKINNTKIMGDCRYEQKGHIEAKRTKKENYQ